MSNPIDDFNKSARELLGPRRPFPIQPPNSVLLNHPKGRGLFEINGLDLAMRAGRFMEASGFQGRAEINNDSWWDGEDSHSFLVFTFWNANEALAFKMHFADELFMIPEGAEAP